MIATKKPSNENGKMTSKCHWHPRRVAVACGTQTRRGYCRKCHTFVNRPLPFDASIWLAALVALVLGLLGGVGCGGSSFGGGTADGVDGGDGSVSSQDGGDANVSSGSGGAPQEASAGSGGVPGRSKDGGVGGDVAVSSGGSSGSPGSGGSGGSSAAGGTSSSGGSSADAGFEYPSCTSAVNACDSGKCTDACLESCWRGALDIKWAGCCSTAPGYECFCLEPVKCD